MKNNTDPIYLFVPVCAEYVEENADLYERARHILAANGVIAGWDVEVPEDGFFLTDTATAYKASGALGHAGFECSFLLP